jgi:hypothetical protein
MHVVQCTGVPMCAHVLVAVFSVVHLDMCGCELVLVCDIGVDCPRQQHRRL